MNPRNLPVSLALLIMVTLWAPASRAQAPLPATLASIARLAPATHPANPISSLALAGPEGIGEKEAHLILEGIGMLDGKRTFAAAMSGLKYGYTYDKSKDGQLDAEAKAYLYREYLLARAALQRWSAYPTISSTATPQLYEQWMKGAVDRLTAVPIQQRSALMKSLMTQETEQTHWVNFKPSMGAAADTGFGQFLPATAAEVGINPYDPAQNLMGIAVYLDGLVRTRGIARALVAYNGGSRPKPAAYRYASAILGRLGLPYGHRRAAGSARRRRHRTVLASAGSIRHRG